MEDFALTPAERALLTALNRHGVRFLVIGLGAAVLQGAPLSTQDVDLWLERPGDEHLRQVLPLERIIVSKRSTNRPKDLAALPSLEATLRARDGGR